MEHLVFSLFHLHFAPRYTILLLLFSVMAMLFFHFCMVITRFHFALDYVIISICREKQIFHDRALLYLNSIHYTTR